MQRIVFQNCVLEYICIFSFFSLHIFFFLKIVLKLLWPEVLCQGNLKFLLQTKSKVKKSRRCFDIFWTELFRKIPKAKEITPRTAGAAEWKELFFSSLKIRAKLWGHYFPNFNQDFNTKKIDYVRRKMHSGAVLAGRVSDSARSQPAAGHSTTNALTSPDINKIALQCAPPASR